MKILFASTEPHLPEFFGGIERSTDALAQALKAKGADVRLHVGIAYRKPGRWRWIAEAIWRKCFGEIRTPPALPFSGYRVSRSLRPAATLRDHVQRYRPDAVIINGGDRAALVAALEGCNTKVAVYICDVGHLADKASLEPFREVGLITNSKYTAQHVKALTGRDSLVIPPSLRWQDYVVADYAPEAVLFVNPKREKGLDLVLAVARCLPDIPFLIVEGWTLARQERLALEKQVAACGNITLMPNQQDMKAVYRRARLLMAPTGTNPDAPITETWGRVATEAEISGIPVIASNSGGFPESVGPGGILIRPDAPLEDWVQAVRSLWDNPDRLAALSAKAIAHARSDLLVPEQHAEMLLAYLSRP